MHSAFGLRKCVLFMPHFSFQLWLQAPLRQSRYDKLVSRRLISHLLPSDLFDAKHSQLAVFLSLAASCCERQAPAKLISLIYILVSSGDSFENLLNGFECINELNCRGKGPERARDLFLPSESDWRLYSCLPSTRDWCDGRTEEWGLPDERREVECKYKCLKFTDCRCSHFRRMLTARENIFRLAFRGWHVVRTRAEPSRAIDSSARHCHPNKLAECTRWMPRQQFNQAAEQRTVGCLPNSPGIRRNCSAHNACCNMFPYNWKCVSPSIEFVAPPNE